MALGAAVQAGILGHGQPRQAAARRDAAVARHRDHGRRASKIIHRNSTIPATGTEIFTTAVDGQTAVLIHVLQGERELVKDCRSLGALRARGHPADARRPGARRGAFLIDANGILNVTASECAPESSRPSR